jgi:hypothetical protein
MSDIAGVFLAVALTLVVYSYLWRDNLLFRLVEHLFIGVAVGYIVIIAVHNMLLPSLVMPLLRPKGMEDRLLIIPLVLGMLLLAKGHPSLAALGNSAMGYLMGTGAALALGGALLGTLLPQVQAAMGLSLNPKSYRVSGSERVLEALIMSIGTVGTLLYFTFAVKGKAVSGVVRIWGEAVGRSIILVTLGALFAAAAMSRVALLIGRLRFLVEALVWLKG